MTRDGAQEAINAAAILTAGIYLYRKLVEPPAAESTTGAARRAPGQPAAPTGPLGLRELSALRSAWGPQPDTLRSIPAQVLLGVGPVAPVPRFVVGWGFTFIVLALLAQAQPDLGGYFALLIAAGAVLGNGAKVGADINHQLSAKRAGSAGVSTAAGAAPTVTVDYAGGSVARVGGTPRPPRVGGGTPA